MFSITSNVFSRETFEFDLGQKINILSDKAYRRTRENEFQAIGNVVITHLKNAIYGDRALLNFNNGHTEVEGSVRLISPGVTFYGSKLSYNFLSKEIFLEDARILSDSFSIVGRKVYQTSPIDIQAYDAEYTTCRDCPESWSVFGKSINVTVGKYVRIHDAYFKVNGMIVFYLPYIIFPIKQQRETGLLFPMMGHKKNEGMRFQQPFFWAINEQSDATISPGVFGSRGYGGDIEYRHVFGEKTWAKTNFFFIDDKIYAPYKDNAELSGGKKFRYFANGELHGIYRQFLNGHLYFNRGSDLDLKRDFSQSVDDKILGTEFGVGAFLEARFNRISVDLEAYHNQNLLFADPLKTDQTYVQILPKLSLHTMPWELYSSTLPLLKKVSTHSTIEGTLFRQNKSFDNRTIRNAGRLNLGQELQWNLGNLGPVFFQHKASFNMQHYDLFHEQERTFNKSSFVFETEAKLEAEKIVGVSYLEEKKKVDLIDDQSLDHLNLISTLPSLNPKKIVESIENEHYSYRHVQEFKLKHYALSKERFHGNLNFYEQIKNDVGQFDYLDALKSNEYKQNIISANDSLPLKNTLEFQWNNFLIRKASKGADPYQNGRYLKDNFDYRNIYSFHLSQGVDLSLKNQQFSRRLTRLYLQSSVDLDRGSLNAQEFYYHLTGEHKFTTEAMLHFDAMKWGGRFTYNSFNSSTVQIIRTLGMSTELRFSDLLTFKNIFDFNIQNHELTKSFYSLMYSPKNNCWKIEVNFAKDLIESRLGLIFYINYNEKNFAPLGLF